MNFQNYHKLTYNNYPISLFPDEIQSMARQTCQVAGEAGTCMFVWECLKTEGKHLGMCMDGFMFGSCCVHNDDQNKVKWFWSFF